MMKFTNKLNLHPESLHDRNKKYLLWLFSPLLALAKSFASPRTKSSYIIFFLFMLQIGLCVTMGVDRFEGSGDAISYRQWFEENYRNPSATSDYIQGLESYFINRDSYDKDQYANTLMYLVSRFTGNYHVFFLIVAILPALFMLKWMRYYTQDDKYRVSFLSIIPVVWFVFGHINAVGGVRYYAAAWICLYSIFKIFQEKKTIYYLLAAASCLVHISFAPIILLLMIASFTKEFELFWKIAFFCGAVFSTLSLIILGDISAYLPPFMSQMVDFYIDENRVNPEVRGSGFYLIGRAFNQAAPFVLIAIEVVFMLNNNVIKQNSKSRDLYRLLLVLGSYANFFMAVPSMGERVMARIVLPLTCYIWMVNSQSLKRSKWILWLYLIVNVFTIRHLIEQYTSYMQIDFYIASPIYLFIKYALLG